MITLTKTKRIWSVEDMNEYTYYSAHSRRLVMDYINNAIPNTVNESSSDEELEQEVFEAVQNLNTLCHIVNEYFNYEG